MSLKFFHIAFVIASIAMSLFVCWWGVRDYLNTGSIVNLSIGIGTLVLAGVLVWYSTWFVRKIRTFHL